MTSLAISSPRTPFLANFRIAVHPLEIDSFIQHATFHLPTLAISRMTIHGQIVDLKNGKKCFDQLRHCRGQSFTGCEGVQIPMGTPTHETAVSRARGIADRVLAPLAAQNDKAWRFSTEAVNALTRAGLPGLMLPAEAGENLNRYCSFCLGTRTWTPQRTAFRPVPRRDR